MKKKEIETKKTRTTFNYKADTHEQFCKRCLRKNRICPVSGSPCPSTKCSI